MKPRFVTNKLHPKLLNHGRFISQHIVAAVILVVALFLMLPVSTSAQLDVVVIARQRKLAGIEAYTYTFNATYNGSLGNIEFFAVTYPGSAPLAHTEPETWDFTVQEITLADGTILQTINWSTGSFSGAIRQNETAGFQFTLPAPTSGASWVLQDKDATGNSASDSIAFDNPMEPQPDYTASTPLASGLNIISLPLNPNQPFTASSLAATLGSTLVIRAEAGAFQVYVPAGAVGEDFSIESGKGYIVNLTSARTFQVIGKPWGEPAAPSANPAEPWAFVVMGHIVDGLPVDTAARITNPRTGQILRLPVQADGTFVGAFVDMINQRAVVAPGDKLRLELIDGRGQPLGEPQYPQIVSGDIARAYMRATLTASPQQARLLQNFPNPFNPETWVPYQLDQDAAVTIQIYDAAGQLIRLLELGGQSAGFYTSREQAAYWNGKNQYGEAVASGSYYVHLQAGSFHAVRKMVVLK